MDLNKLKINDVALDMLMDKIDSFPGQKHYTRISDGKIDDTLMRGKVFNDSFCEDIYFTGRRRVSNMSHVCTEVVNIYGGCKTYYRSKCIDIVYSLFGDVSWRRVKSRIPVHVGTTDHLIAITDDIPVASINNSYMYDGPASYHV